MILNPEQIDELLEEDSDTNESDAESESEPESQNFTARRKRQAITNTNKMWNPDKAIPYHIENSLGRCPEKFNNQE
ncbi:unnamed protein product [Cylicostephanus goldi]|uniref:Uncharacterized protein n=1 Tax=Cylicostephanus goldi TaxID=71465 RepID=A0A3P7N2K8_CYLGO|nr:unnamed protein product [Cylicostephanus goldi]